MGARLLTLSCNQCGAPLSAPEGTRFLTCEHCTSRLLIEYSGDAYYTSVLDRIEKQVTEADSTVEVVRLQLEIERREREWLVEKNKYLVSFPDGSRRDPQEALQSTTVGGVLSTGCSSRACSLSPGVAERTRPSVHHKHLAKGYGLTKASKMAAAFSVGETRWGQGPRPAPGLVGAYRYW